MRHELEKRMGDHQTFTGPFERFGKKKAYAGFESAVIHGARRISSDGPS